MKAKIVVAFHCTGKTYARKNYSKYVNILDLNLGWHKTIKRKRTPEELEECRKKWDSVPHLLGGDAYVNRIKDEEITVPNPNFLKDCIKHIKREMRNYEVILLEFYPEIIEALEKEHMSFSTIMPEDDLKEAYIGRMFLANYDKYKIKGICKVWEEWSDKYNPSKYNDLLYLGLNEYIDIEILSMVTGINLRKRYKEKKGIK